MGLQNFRTGKMFSVDWFAGRKLVAQLPPK
jgi:hypothetical protein